MRVQTFVDLICQKFYLMNEAKLKSKDYHALKIQLLINPFITDVLDQSHTFHNF